MRHLSAMVEDLELKAKETEDRTRGEMIEMQKKNIDL